MQYPKSDTSATRSASESWDGISIFMTLSYHSKMIGVARCWIGLSKNDDVC